MRRLLPLLCGLLLAACGQRAVRPIGDFTLPVYTPRYASGFEITGAAGSRSTLVTVHNPWYGDEVTDQYLFIARDGEPAPAGFEGQVLRDEARRVVCMSGSYIAMLDALGAADRVVGVSGAQYLINETLRRRIARGEAADVGFDSNVDFERLMALRPDLVMLFGIGGADTALTGKLRELGIPYLYMGEHCEESPLGKSEWVVVAAEIAGLRTEGSRLFAAIPERYERLRALAQQTAARPRVMLNTPYRDTWFMPARNSYMVRLLEDVPCAGRIPGWPTRLPCARGASTTTTAAATRRAAAISGNRAYCVPTACWRIWCTSSTPNSPKRTNCTITGSWNNAEAALLRRIRPLLRFSRRRRPHRSFSANFLTVRK